MGFGLIFTGYITLLFFKVLPPAMLVGAYLMRRGLAKLARYGKKFGAAKDCASVLTVYFALYTAFWLGELFGVSQVLSLTVFEYADTAVYLALLAVFHVLLYAALEQIARECGYEKGIKKIAFAKVLLAMFLAFSLLTLVLTAFSRAAVLSFASLLCQVVWYIHTAVLLYGFYMRVATQEIIDEEEKKLAEYDRHTIKIGRKKK